MQIQDFPRKLAPGDSDLLLIQDSTDNAYKSIEKSSLGAEVVEVGTLSMQSCPTQNQAALWEELFSSHGNC